MKVGATYLREVNWKFEVLLDDFGIDAFAARINNSVEINDVADLQVAKSVQIWVGA